MSIRHFEDEDFRRDYPEEVKEVVFTPDMIEAMFYAWNKSGAETAGASWSIFISELTKSELSSKKLYTSLCYC